MDTPASVTITKMILDSLPVSAPLLVGIIVQAILTINSASKARKEAADAKKEAADAKVIVQSTAKAVDGQMSEFKVALSEMSAIKVELASLRANKAGVEEGKTSAKLQAAEVAEARSLPPINPPSGQADRIEQTGDDTNRDVKVVKENTDRRVANVEEKVAEIKKEQ